MPWYRSTTLPTSRDDPSGAQFLSCEFFSQTDPHERAVDVPIKVIRLAPHDQTVEVTRPQILEETVERSQWSLFERVEQRTVEQITGAPQFLEETAEAERCWSHENACSHGSTSKLWKCLIHKIRRTWCSDWLASGVTLSKAGVPLKHRLMLVEIPTSSFLPSHPSPNMSYHLTVTWSHRPMSEACDGTSLNTCIVQIFSSKQRLCMFNWSRSWRVSLRPNSISWSSVTLHQRNHRTQQKRRHISNTETCLRGNKKVHSGRCKHTPG